VEHEKPDARFLSFSSIDCILPEPVRTDESDARIHHTSPFVHIDLSVSLFLCQSSCIPRLAPIKKGMAHAIPFGY